MKEQLKAKCATLKENLILSDDAKSMFVDLLISIDFKQCDDDFETLQLFFKRVYSGIEELKKRNKEYKEEIEKLKLQLPEQDPVLPLEKPYIKENY